MALPIAESEPHSKGYGNPNPLREGKLDHSFRKLTGNRQRTTNLVYQHRRPAFLTTHW